jgi:hypothetical protein
MHRERYITPPKDVSALVSENLTNSMCIQRDREANISLRHPLLYSSVLRIADDESQLHLE